MSSIRFTAVVRTVRQTAKELSAAVPDWYNMIDLSTLDINYHSKCIVGQLQSKGYFQHLDIFDEKRGFHLATSRHMIRGQRIVTSGGLREKGNNAVLTKIWKRQILRMRKAEICQQLAIATRELETATK